MNPTQTSGPGLLLRGRKRLALVPSALLFLFAIAVPPAFGDEDPLIAVYLDRPVAADDDEIQELLRLEQLIVGHLEFYLPPSFDEPVTVKEKQINEKKSYEAFIKANPRIEYLVHLKFLPRYPNGDWTFKCRQYQRKGEGDGAFVERQRCQNPKFDLISPYGRDQIIKVAKSIACSLFPPKCEPLPEKSTPRVVYTTCFKVSPVIEYAWLRKALETESLVLPKELQATLGPTMRKKEYIFDGFSPAQAEVCITDPHSAIPPPGKYYYELVGLIASSERGSEWLIVKMFFVGVDRDVVAFVDEANRPLKVHENQHELLDVHIAKFITRYWDSNIRKSQ